MLKAIIIDDEQPCIDRINQLLEHQNEISIIETALTIQSAKELIKTHKPDLIFLDIDLSDRTGFDLLEQFPNPNFQVIFTTGYNEYALKAFRHSAIYYLLKPIEKEQLFSAIDKAIIQKGNAKNTEKLDLMMKSLQSKNFSKIIIPLLDSYEFINKDEIISFKSDSKINFLTKKEEVIK